ncbi:hypothetical protein Tco_1014459, partial [Tanacetum coccineum]
PEEDDEDPEEDPADYPTDRDDDDDEEEDEDEDEEEEEEHPAPADSVSPIHPSPPASHIHPLGYQAAMIRLRAETPSTSHPLPLPTSSPPLQLLSSDRRADMPEITLPPRKRLGINLGLRCEVGESSAATAARPIGGRRADYGSDDRDPGEVAMGLESLGRPKIGCLGVAPDGPLNGQDLSVFETLVDDSQYHFETARTTRSGEGLVSQKAMGTLFIEAADRRSQIVTSEMLQADHRRQAEIVALQTFDYTRQELRACCGDFVIDAVRTFGDGSRGDPSTPG